MSNFSSQTGGSPIMNYGGYDNGYNGGGGLFSCDPGAEIDPMKIIFGVFILYILLYIVFPWVYINMYSETFGSTDGSIYNEQWNTDYPEQSIYNGKYGFGLNFAGE
jgi:hypothetical protein